MGQRELDSELNKLQKNSLFASPGSYSFTPGITASLCGEDSHSPWPASSTRLLGGRGGGAWPQRPVSLTTGCESNKNPGELGKLIGSLEKARGSSQTQADLPPGEQRSPRASSLSLSLSSSWPALTPDSPLHSHIFSPWLCGCSSRVADGRWTAHTSFRWEPEYLSTATGYSWGHNAGLNWALRRHSLSGRGLSGPGFPWQDPRRGDSRAAFRWNVPFSHSTVSCAWILGMFSLWSHERA